jgi:integrase
MRAYVYKPRRLRGGKRIVGKFWRLRFKADGEKRYREKSLGTTDKVVAEERRRKFVEEKGREAEGIIAPRPLREGARRKLMDHLADLTAELGMLGRDSMYVYTLGKRCEKLIAECGWELPKDVSAESFMAWRRRQKLKGKTLNDYLSDVCVLLNWMKQQGRIGCNPLLGAVEKIRTAGDESDRRALTDDEVSGLLNVAGPRKAVYLMAVRTGLRRAELKALRWSDVHLEGDKPFLSVRASTTKNGKPATMWLGADLVAELLPVGPASGAVFADGVPSMEQFRADLASAGITEADGRKVVFHSLRHTLATQLARSSVPPRVSMEVMRHSDLRLTMKAYTDSSMLPTCEVLGQLPVYAIAASDTQKDAQKSFPERSGASKCARSGEAGSDPKSQEKARKTADLARCVPVCPEGGESWGTRIRT